MVVSGATQASLACILAESLMATLLQPVTVHKRICIGGVVQGVGFRPFVYRLAQRFRIRGLIFNTSSGVVIEAEGDEPSLREFVQTLQAEPPPLARLEEVSVVELPPASFETFEIAQSTPELGGFAFVPADTAVCDECYREVMDPADRRYGYPFTNCTNCGPRYTIIRNVPYDRPETTMASFAMCGQCSAEYHDPGDRRFHAQPNACPACGPSIALVKSNPSLPFATAFPAADARSVVDQVQRVLRAGEIVAIKGLGGFQLACDAENDQAVRELRRRKQRSDKPFALMARDIGVIEELCRVTEFDRNLLLSPQRPIVILPRRMEGDVASAIAPGNNTLGVMLPYTPLHAMLFQDGEDAAQFQHCRLLVMTSGNISDEPIVTSNEVAWQRLGSVADWFLFHNRDIHMRVDDSVAHTFDGAARVLRRARGYVPQAIDLGFPVPELLACGAQLKNTFCLTKGHYAALSQHIGDLENYETLEFFRETLGNLKKLLHVEPRAVAHDLHPLYLSTRLAKESGLPTIAVQHHHAHIVSCMAENRLQGKVIGVAFDGTGYGTDHQIWGGEFLVADRKTFERRAHLRYVPLAGGDAAVHQPWRSAFAWLRESFGTELPRHLDLLRDVPERELKLVAGMVESGFNTVNTSSCGRLFDAVASLIGLRHVTTFEGQAAIELEMIAQPGIEDCYSFEFESCEPLQIDLRPAIREIVCDLASGVAKPAIAARFHNTMAALIGEVCQRIRNSEPLDRVCLSGGTFQNIYLLQRTVACLKRAGFQVFLHALVPPNDGGISLGQAVVATEVLR